MATPNLPAIPFRTTTRGGSQAVVLHDFQTGIKPLLGAYYNNAGEWIPTSWSYTGFYDGALVENHLVTGLDLVIPIKEQQHPKAEEKSE